MDEGVDPANVCKSLMEKLSRSEQLRIVADPEILILFEDWLEELEIEVLSLIEKKGSIDADNLAKELGLSSRGIRFLIAKLKSEKKLKNEEVL